MKTLLLFVGYTEFLFVLGLILGHYVITDGTLVTSILEVVAGTVIVIVSTALTLAYIEERRK